jgi:hypothetical protein
MNLFSVGICGFKKDLALKHLNPEEEAIIYGFYQNQ